MKKPNTKANPRLVFKPEVLDRVGISYALLWDWMRTGKFPMARQVGGKTAWVESEIDEWITSRPRRQYKPRPDKVEV
jgi:predicted DNA-binding transcriptional regulator AlpA